MSTWVLFVYVVFSGSAASTTIPGFASQAKCLTASIMVEEKLRGLSSGRVIFCLEQKGSQAP